LEKTVWEYGEDAVQYRKTTVGMRGNPKFKLQPAHRAWMRGREALRRDLLESVRVRNATYQAHQKRIFDQKRTKPLHFPPNANVAVDTTDAHTGNAAKLPLNRDIGTIIDKIGDNAYVVKLLKDGRYMPVNVARMYRILPMKDDFKRGSSASARRHAKASSKVRRKLSEKARQKHTREMNILYGIRELNIGLISQSKRRRIERRTK